jgi:hypothetical protein
MAHDHASGWKVEAADGSPVGRSTRSPATRAPTSSTDSAIATTALGHPRYVPAEKVAEITDGIVRLALSPGEVQALEEYRLPPTSLEVEPDQGGGVIASAEAEIREVSGDLVQPVRPSAERVGLLDRIRFFVLRKRSS